MAQRHRLRDSVVTIGSTCLQNHGLNLFCLDCHHHAAWSPAQLAAVEPPSRRVWDFKRTEGSVKLRLAVVQPARTNRRKRSLFCYRRIWTKVTNFGLPKEPAGMDTPLLHREDDGVPTRDSEFVARWMQHRSGTARYFRRDLVGSRVLHHLSESLAARVRSTRLGLYVAAFSLVAFCILAALRITGYEFPAYSVSGDPITDILLLWTVEWLGFSEALTGNSYTITLVVIFLSLLYFGLGFLFRRREYGEARATQHMLRGSLQSATQIYPGSASLCFSYGSAGLCVQGVMIGMCIDWPAVLFVAPIVAKNWNFRITANTWEATHLLVLLHPPASRDTEPTDFLIIPRRFFNQADSTPWDDFVANLSQYCSGALPPDIKDHLSTS